MSDHAARLTHEVGVCLREKDRVQLNKHRR
jgi:hypothetical protein